MWGHLTPDPSASLCGYGRRAHFPQRGSAPLGGSGQHAQTLGGGEDRPGPARSLDRHRSRAGTGGGADARARLLAGGSARGRARGPARVRLHRGALPPRPRSGSRSSDVAAETGLEPELIERILVILGTPKGRQRELSPEDAAALRHCARVLAAGFPLVAFLQLVRVYVQSMRRIADAEVRLFHLYVHEPLIRDAVPELEMAAEMGDLAADILPLAAPLTEYLHNRYLRFFIEQDVVGHMESGLGADTAEIELGQVTMTLCFIDLSGFTRYTEEEGDMEALDVIENFVETVESTLPREAAIVKTIGDEVMVVSPDAAALTEWAVGFLEPLSGATATAGRDPLRRGRLPRRRLLRQPGQPRPPGRQPRPRRRGPGHRPGRGGDRGSRRPWPRGDRPGQPQGLPGSDRAVPGPRRRLSGRS